MEALTGEVIKVEVRHFRSLRMDAYTVLRETEGLIPRRTQLRYTKTARLQDGLLCLTQCVFYSVQVCEFGPETYFSYLLEISPSAILDET
jgi:hypothetical protein